MFFNKRQPKIEELEQRTVPATFTVTNLNDDGLGSLRAAVVLANLAPGADTVGFQAGLTGTILLTSGGISFSETATVTGPGADQLTISGNDSSEIFSMLAIGAHSLTVEGLRFIDGNTLIAGAAIDVGGDESLTVRGCIFENNDGSDGAVAALGDDTVNIIVENSIFRNNTGVNQGGGLYASGDSVTITDSIFQGNIAGGAGGGVYLTGNENDIVVERSQFIGNSANAFGGGLVTNTQTTMRISDSLFSGNQTNGSGGGLDIFGQMTGTIERSDFLNNSAGDNGGGAQIIASQINVVDSTFDGNYSNEVGGGVEIGNEVNFSGTTFSNNSARRRGGGIAFGLITKSLISNSTITQNFVTEAGGVGGGIDAFDTLDIQNSTIAENTAPGSGGGIMANLGLDLSIVSTIVADNIVTEATDQSPDVAGDFTTLGNNLFGSAGTLDITIAATDQRVEDANLGDLQDNGGRTLTRLPGGAAVGRGANPANLAFDQRGDGFPRGDGGVDIGAVEGTGSGTSGGSGGGGGLGVVDTSKGLGVLVPAQFSGPDLNFLQAVYRRVLGREVDAVGLKGFGDRLNAGEAREQIVREIWESKEHRELQTRLLLSDLFGTSAGVTAPSAFITQFKDGAGTLEVIREMVASTAFSAQTATPKEIILNLYAIMLERVPSDAEVQNWLTKLENREIHTSDVAKAFVASDEFHQVLVRKMYTAFLDRDPESDSGLKATSQSIGGGHSLDEAAISILASDEFLVNVAGRLV